MACRLFAIIWKKAGILLIEPMQTYFSAVGNLNQNTRTTKIIRIYILRCYLQNDCHFVKPRLCERLYPYPAQYIFNWLIKRKTPCPKFLMLIPFEKPVLSTTSMKSHLTIPFTCVIMIQFLVHTSTKDWLMKIMSTQLMPPTMGIILCYVAITNLQFY